MTLSQDSRTQDQQSNPGPFEQKQKANKSTATFYHRNVIRPSLLVIAAEAYKLSIEAHYYMAL
jgi:hypothetical protein